MIFTKVLNISLKNEDQIEKSKYNKVSLICGLILFAIIITISELLEVLAIIIPFFMVLNNGYFFFATMSLLYFPLFKKIYNAISDSSIPTQYILFLKIWIIIFWVIAFLFLSIEFLGIHVDDIDIFNLGFIWAFSMVVILSGIFFLINTLLNKEKKIPKNTLIRVLILSGLISFGIWSIQLFIVEIYLKRLFGVILYDQDIRILILVVSIIYITSFYLLLKYVFFSKMKEKQHKKLKNISQIKANNSNNDKNGITKNEKILEVKNLVTRFYTEEGIVKALDGVNFEIYNGEVLGLVGETGCGKSVTALSIIQLIQSPGRIENGEVIFMDEDLLKKSNDEIRKYRGKKITMIFQDPLNSLNPVYKVGNQIDEVFLLHMEDELIQEALKRKNASIYSIAKEWSIELLEDLKIPNAEKIYDRYPHELSGGMRQRVQIAMGLACSPILLIADEPTTALDVTIQRQILKLMKDLREKYNTSILYITHDLGIISKLCDKVAVMYSGHIIEYGKRYDLFEKPLHPYTKGLMASIPEVGERKKDLNVIPGTVPNLIYPPSGCRFHPRCYKCFEPCDNIRPRPIEVEEGHYVECHLYNNRFFEMKEKNKNKIKTIER